MRERRDLDVVEPPHGEPEDGENFHPSTYKHSLACNLTAHRPYFRSNPLTPSILPSFGKLQAGDFSLLVREEYLPKEFH